LKILRKQALKKSVNSWKYSLSQKIGVLTLLLYGIDFLFDGKISAQLLLNTSLVVNQIEFWRLFTFPFAQSGPETILLFVFTFFMISTKVELIMKNRFYHLILFLLICLQGTTFTIFYRSETYILSGMTGISFFVLSLFILLNITGRLTPYKKKPVRSMLMIAAASLAWVSVITMKSVILGSDTVAPELASASFGILSGLLIYCQIVLLNWGTLHLKRKTSERKVIPEPEEYSPAFISSAEHRKFFGRDREYEDYMMYEPEPDLSEDRLNEILDKINEYGKESLSPDEIRFLKEYSKSL